MSIEYEATFPGVSKELIQGKLEMLGARILRPESLLKRAVFRFPKGHERYGAWLRVRDEGDRVTMSYKCLDDRAGDKIENQTEIILTVNSFDEAQDFLEVIGCEKKAYQENKREVWDLDGVEIDVDEWPFLEPFVEIEGPSEEDVKATSDKLGFDYADAMFCSVDVLYSQKYGVTKDVINNQTPELTFERNPFEKNKK